MSAIEALKLAGPIAVKTAAGTTKVKTDAPIEAGAFSKLLSSVSNEESIEQEQESAVLLADMEAALVQLQQLPPEELQPEQQELLAALAQLLALHQVQALGEVEEKPSGYVKSAHLEATAQADLPSEPPAAESSIKEKMVGLMHQIAHEVQELGNGSAKEFADVPIFMGVKKEYILNKPNKVNEVINLMINAAKNLETMQTPERLAMSAKLADKVQELLQLFSGTVQEIEVPAEQQRKYEPPPLPLAQKINSQPAAASMDAIAAQERIEPAPALTVPLETAKAVPVPSRPELPVAPAPVVRMASLANDLGALLGSSAKLSGTGETAQLKVSIFPEHLGQLEIRLSTVDGKVAAQILTSSPMAKEALELQVYQLRNSLIQQGIQVDRIEISSQQAGQSLSQQQGQQEQRFARQHRQQPTAKNGYQQNGEEAAGFVRGVSSDRSVMAVDYTI